MHGAGCCGRRPSALTEGGDAFRRRGARKGCTGREVAGGCGMIIFSRLFGDSLRELLRGLRSHGRSSDSFRGVDRLRRKLGEALVVLGRVVLGDAIVLAEEGGDGHLESLERALATGADLCEIDGGLRLVANSKDEDLLRSPRLGRVAIGL